MKKPESVNICYIRIDALYRNYFLAKHGTPAVFSPSSELAAIIRDNLMDNPFMRAQSDGLHLSFSDLAFNYKEKGRILDADVHMPDESERDQFVAINIPDEVRRFAGIIKTGPTWQLNRFGARRFREEVKTSFWREFRNFERDCVERGQLNGEAAGLEDIVSDFMTMFNIPMSLYENMLRYERRERNTSATKIEKRREVIKNLTGNNYLYT